jgi:uncharacterized membrane protein
VAGELAFDILYCLLMMLRKILLFITGMILVLVTGVFWGSWFSLSRIMHTFSVETFIAIEKQMIQYVAVGMNIMMTLGIIGVLALLFMAGKRKKTHLYWLLSTLILFVVALLITVFIQLPVDNQIKTWTADSMPTDWQGIRDRWQFYNTSRTFISLVGIACYLMAVIKRYS